MFVAASVNENHFLKVDIYLHFGKHSLITPMLLASAPMDIIFDMIFYLIN